MAKVGQKSRAGNIVKKAHSQRKRRKKSYAHSAYWYATKYGWTVSDAATYTQKYFDDVYHGFAGKIALSSGRHYADPVMVGACMATDLVVKIGRKIKENVIDPIKRGEAQERLRRDYLRFRRPAYYARETAYRHALMDERRKIRRRTTSAPKPTPEAIREAWESRRASKAAKIILGGMLHDLECYVDNRLRWDEKGNIVGRNHGIKGWIAENLRDLLPHYKALMYYKELAMKLRQATDTHDPTPTFAILPTAFRPQAVIPAGKNFSRISEHGEIQDITGIEAVDRNGASPTGGGERGIGIGRLIGADGKVHAVMGEIFADSRQTATSILRILDDYISPKKIFAGQSISGQTARAKT